MNKFTYLREELQKKENKTISYTNLANRLGLTAPRICELETEKREPSRSELKAYHNYFKVSYEYLLNETEEFVSTDIFKEKPIVESKEENTLRWLKNSEYEDENELYKMITHLAGTDQGLATLYYLNELRKSSDYDNKLLYAVRDLVKNKYDDYTLIDLRNLMDNKYNL